ncbi:MAG: TerC family protein [Betaproteobacteria bacterium]|nr:TerC family protein [Betaproteobacteria bacterium]
MELFSRVWFSALLSIVFIDLLLAGDNAVVIGMAASSLPERLQKKAVIFGTIGAVAVRVIGGVFAVYLLQIPYVALVGGLVLLWIAHKLVSDDGAAKHKGVAPAANLAGAIRTIVIADAAMGIDNVLAIAAAARGDASLVALGVLISIPMVMWGSFMVVSLLKRWPWLAWAGAALLGYIAVSLIIKDPLIADRFTDISIFVSYALYALAASFFFCYGWFNHRRRKDAAADG